MTDAKKEALRAALDYHQHQSNIATAVAKKPKLASAQEVVRTARLFELFLSKRP